MTTIVVTKVIQTSYAYPSQFEGDTADGQYIYARYRGGRMRVDVAPTAEAWMGAGSWAIHSEEFGDPLDGYLSYEELKEHTRGIIEWPEHLSDTV